MYIHGMICEAQWNWPLVKPDSAITFNAETYKNYSLRTLTELLQMCKPIIVIIHDKWEGHGRIRPFDKPNSLRLASLGTTTISRGGMPWGTLTTVCPSLGVDQLPLAHILWLVEHDLIRSCHLATVSRSTTTQARRATGTQVALRFLGNRFTSNKINKKRILPEG